MFQSRYYTITVINRRLELNRRGEYVGRPSLLGNPYQIGKDGTREQVIQKYRCWLWGQLRQRGSVHAKLLKLRNQASVSDLTLICWCAPLYCHADVIKSCLEWMMTPAYEKWLEQQDNPPGYNPDWLEESRDYFEPY